MENKIPTAVAWWNKINNLPMIGMGFKDVIEPITFIEFLKSLNKQD